MSSLAKVVAAMSTLFVALLLGGCSRSELEATRERTPVVLEPPRITLAATSPSASKICERRIRRLLATGRHEPSRAERERRLRILTSAPAEPVLFVREPRRDARARLGVRAHALALEKSRRPAELLERLLPSLAADPELARQVLLREGYLHADTPELAAALVAQVAPHHLFTESRIWIQRGQRLGWARRGADGRYLWTDGAERGRAVQLVLFDRVGVGGVPPAALHRDLRELEYRLHFDAARIRHLSEAELVLDLRYGDHWVASLLTSAGARLELECEAPDFGEAGAVADLRMRGARRERALRAVRRWLLSEIDGKNADPARSVKDAGASPAWTSTLAALLRGSERTLASRDGLEQRNDSSSPRSGEIVISEGRRLFVYEDDPLTGAPLVAVELSPRARLRPWRPALEGSERIRPTLAWLEANVPALEDPLLVPPPIAIAPRRD